MTILHFLIPICVLSIEFKHIQAPPEARVNANVFYLKSQDELLIILGDKGRKKSFDEIWVYSLQKDHWLEILSVSEYSPGPRTGHCAVYFEDKSEIYIYGGHKYIGISNELWKYNILYKSWSKGKENPSISGAYKHSCACSQTDLYVFGGFITDSFSNSVFKYNILSEDWEEIVTTGEKPSPRHSASLHYYENSLYVWGGNTINNNLYTLDLNTLHWTSTSTTIPSFYSHSSIIYNNFLYILFGLSSGISNTWVYKLDIITSQVVNKTDYQNSLLPRSSFSLTPYNSSQAFIFGGNSTSDYLNDVWLFDLESGVFKEISSSFYAPNSRSMHQMVTLGNELYIFGGKNSDKLYFLNRFNDLQAYDIMKNTWSLISASGDIPSSRHSFSMASNGLSLYLFGGKSSDKVLNDFYVYNKRSTSWTAISTNTIITERDGACMAYAFPYFFIFGGKSENDVLFNDLWIIDERTFEIISINPSSESPTPVAYHNCFATTQSDDISFYIVSGKTQGNSAISSMWKFSYNKSSWTLILSDPALNRYDASLIKTGSYVFLFGGRNSLENCITSVAIITIKDTYNIKVLDSECEDNDYCVFNKCLISSASTSASNKIYIHGGLMQDLLIKSEKASNDFLSLNINQLISSNYCSIGSYILSISDELICKICDKGYYCNIENSTSVIACPKGTFNKYYGASSLLSCEPCDYGTCNPLEGQYTCKDCPIGYICNAGCEEPILSYLSTSIIQSSQPDLFPNNIQEANYYKYIAMWIIISSGVTIILMSRVFNKCRKFVRKLDMFKAGHNYIDGAKMILNKTYIGGYYTVMFGSLLAYMIISTLITLLVNYYYESKSLVPFITVADDYTILGNLIIEIEFNEYGGECVDLFGNCKNEIKANVDGISGQLSYSCSKIDKVCKVNWKCENCDVINDSTLTVELQELNSFASSLAVKIISDSSIPEGQSEISLSIFPEIQGYIFRGSNPSIIPVQFIPSVFLSDMSKYPSKLTGYHLSIINSPTPGSSMPVIDLPTNSNLKLNIHVNREENVLLTKRYTTSNWVQSLILLLGTGFGFSELCYLIMRNHERAYKKIHNLLKSRNLKNIVLKSAKKIAASLIDSSLKRYSKCDPSGFSTSLQDQRLTLEITEDVNLDYDDDDD
ncbi:hypothetical protein SteCoe_8423 [Stentor coeruleus]|uniref:Attractin/MKLN-like beta-propeller domain-containing protein n=1 Tax=Stentor coeruleus TaxID=5963 RepID=A0A1R2CK59_9CILI|nr:hypothetical protein SteCoe_8423 [Stentor coeruleus]